MKHSQDEGSVRINSPSLKHADTIGLKHNVGFEGKILFAVHFQIQPCREFYVSKLSTFIAFSLICLKINQLRIGLGSEMIDESFEKHEVGLGVFGYFVGPFLDLEEEFKE